MFYATDGYSLCDDDEVKDVLRYLVIEKGIDINSVDEVVFLRCFTFFAILFLVTKLTFIVRMIFFFRRYSTINRIRSECFCQKHMVSQNSHFSPVVY